MYCSLTQSMMRDRLLQVKFLLKCLCFFLEIEYFQGVWFCRDTFIDGIWLIDRLGGSDLCLGDARVVHIIKDKCEGSMASSSCGSLYGRDHLGYLF